MDPIATTDYRKYNLVEPDIKPETRTIDEVRQKLKAAKPSGVAAFSFWLRRRDLNPRPSD